MNIDKQPKRYSFKTETGKTVGELTFFEEDTHMVIDHTFVDPDSRGSGIGAKLVASFVADMKKQGKKIDPICPFAKAEFDKHPEYQELAIT